MSHYFSVKQGTFKGAPFNFSFMGENYIWQGAQGVFSGRALDNGALALLSAVARDYATILDNGIIDDGKAEIQPLISDNSEFERGVRILDLGCGTGIVGLMLALQFPDIEVVLSDVNAWAVQCSAANGKTHKIKNASYLVEDRLTALGEKSFDYVVLNPPIRAGNELILSMFEDSARVLTAKGSLYIVVRAKQGAKRLAELASKWYHNCEFKERKKGYLVFRLSEPKPLLNK